MEATPLRPLPPPLRLLRYCAASHRSSAAGDVADATGAVAACTGHRAAGGGASSLSTLAHEHSARRLQRARLNVACPQRGRGTIDSWHTLP